jgi:alanine-synthesizing transaminase
MPPGGFPFAPRTDWDLQPNRLSLALEEHRRAGREVLDLTESNPTRCGFHYESTEIMKAFLDPANLSYAPDPRGSPTAREAVCAYYEQHGAQVTPEQVLLTTSTSEGYSFLLRLLCDAGDEMLCPRPSYPLLAYLAGLSDVRQRGYELLYDHGWHVDFESARASAASRSRCMLVVHPNNPTGSYVKSAERESLNAFCRERKLAIISDEVFLDYAHASEATQPSFAANADALTFTLSGISKICALPQMKLAWIVAAGPAKLREAALARLEVIADTYLSVSTPTQHALPALLQQRQKMIPQLKTRIAANLAALDAQLAAQTLSTRLAVEGGWYAVLRVPVTRSDDEFALELLEGRNVFVHPGHFYEFAGEGFLVVSLITRAEVFTEGLKRLLTLIGTSDERRIR